MMIYLFIILLATLCLYLIHDIGKYFKIRKTDISKEYFQEKKKLILNIMFYFLVVWYIADTFIQINMLY